MVESIGSKEKVESWIDTALSKKQKIMRMGHHVYKAKDPRSVVMERYLLLFTPIFAMARVAGWLAHILEQRFDNRIYRPTSLYVGPQPKQFAMIEDR
jgi:citrate synthase